MRAAIYSRVSKEIQLENYSLEAQRDECQKLAAGRRWQVVQMYTDEGISAKTTERPGFQAMIRDAKAGHFNVIVVHKLDRFSRSVVDLLMTLQELERAG